MPVRLATGRRRSTFQAQTGEPGHCHWPGCPERGEFRAPQSRAALTSYVWFCLDHIREYNSAWNYYQGMTEDEVEADVRRDTVWQRPSWRLGQDPRSFVHPSGTFRDAFGFFRSDPRETRRPARTPEEKALVVLDLVAPVTVAIVKKRYKQLVKQYHPDANGGDKAAEERFKEISAAYRTVMVSLTAE